MINCTDNNLFKKENMMAAMTAIRTANVDTIMIEGNVENDETGDSKYD